VINQSGTGAAWRNQGFFSAALQCSTPQGHCYAPLSLSSSRNTFPLLLGSVRKLLHKPLRCSPSGEPAAVLLRKAFLRRLIWLNSWADFEALATNPVLCGIVQSTYI